MRQNKIPISISDQNLFVILNEIIDPINKQKNVAFELSKQDISFEDKYSTIIVDTKNFNNLTTRNLTRNFKTIYILGGTQSNPKEKNLDLVSVNFPININEFFERVVIDLEQKTNQVAKIKNFKNFNYDFNSRILFNDKSSLRFTEKQNEIFSCLLSYDKKPISRKELLKHIWQYNEQIDTHTLETHIYSLRKKLESKLGLKNFLMRTDEGYIIDVSQL